MGLEFRIQPLIRCFNLAELVCLLHCRLAWGSSRRPARSQRQAEHRHQCRNFTRGPQGLHRRRFANCVARHATGIQKDDTQAGTARSHQREAADLAVNCEKVAVAEPATPALGAAGLFLIRWPISLLAGAFKFGSERQAPGSLQRLRKAPVIASSGLVLVKRHQSGRDLRDHYQCFPQV